MSETKPPFRQSTSELSEKLPHWKSLENDIWNLGFASATTVSTTVPSACVTLPQISVVL